MSIDIILKKLNENGIELSGEIVDDSDGTYYVSVKVTKRKKKQSPPNKTLRLVSEELIKQGLKIKLLIINDTEKDIESGLRATLLHSYNDLIRNTFLTIHGSRVDVWIDFKKQNISDTELIKINELVKKYLSSFDLVLGTLDSLGKSKTPSKIPILKIIRKYAPIQLADLKEKLEANDYIVPSDDWLNRKLDLYRKSLNIVRLKRGDYVLTQSTIDSLGSSINTNSPDVSRFLALARSARYNN